MDHGLNFALAKISSFFTTVGHWTFKTNVLINLRLKESTLLCMLFVSVYNSELYKNVGVT